MHTAHATPILTKETTFTSVATSEAAYPQKGSKKYQDTTKEYGTGVTTSNKRMEAKKM